MSEESKGIRAVYWAVVMLAAIAISPLYVKATENVDLVIVSCIAMVMAILAVVVLGRLDGKI